MKIAARKQNTAKVAMRGDRWKYFPTVSAAKEYANRIHAKSGVFVEIRYVRRKGVR